VYLATIGPHGLRDVAATGAARATELESALANVGVRRLHPGPYLNEFAIAVPGARAVHRRLLDHGVLAGLVLADAEPDEPPLADGLLVCTTEVTTAHDIARFAEVLGDVLAGRPPVAVEAGAGGAPATVGGGPR
jgi:glycine dehydrogenase subunit 1